MKDFLEIESVYLKRGERLLVSDLGFRLEPGQLALVTGPNGSGKTTLLRTIAGLAQPAQGAIRLGDRLIADMEPEERAAIAYHGHLDGLKKDLSINENLSFINKLNRSTESVSRIVEALGLGPIRHREVRQLSAGQKRRCALAALRLSRARLWLLDEPLTNLDAEGRELVAAWLDEHLQRSGMAVIATHLAADLERPGALLVEL